jgi:hypothetical protein
MTISKHVRYGYWAADSLRRLATPRGDSDKAWNALALGARLETEAYRVEHTVDEAL